MATTRTSQHSKKVIFRFSTAPHGIDEFSRQLRQYQPTPPAWSSMKNEKPKSLKSTIQIKVNHPWAVSTLVNLFHYNNDLLGPICSGFFWYAVDRSHPGKCLVLSLFLFWSNNRRCLDFVCLETGENFSLILRYLFKFIHLKIVNVTMQYKK